MDAGLEALALAARPTDLDTPERLGASQAEAEPRVIMREIAAAAPHLTKLPVHGDTRADRVAIPTTSDQA